MDKYTFAVNGLKFTERGKRESHKKKKRKKYIKYMFTEVFGAIKINGASNPTSKKK